ncbi:MAG: outer membrane lipoprotein-sorting protein [candidate division WOR-3 bacterium]
MFILFISDLDPVKVIKELESLYTSKSAYALISITTKTSEYTKNMEVEVFSKGVMLKSGKNIYLYIPSINRVIKLPEIMMFDTWMGTHLTFEDLVAEGDIEESYDISLSDEVGDTAIIEMKPKKKAKGIYGKIEYRINPKTLTIYSIMFYDKTLKPLRIIKFYDHKTLAERNIPMRITVEPLDKSGEYTEVLYKTLKFDINIPDIMFSPESLGEKK